MPSRTPLLHLLTIVLLAYAQVTLAIAPCVSSSATPASAFTEMPEDCPMQFQAALCLAHCQTTDQSNLQSQVLALPALDAIVLRLPYRHDALAVSGQWHQHHGQRCTGPPPLKLLCSLNL
jgi:hypothetical protein